MHYRYIPPSVDSSPLQLPPVAPKYGPDIFEREAFFLLSRFNHVWDWWLIVWFLSTWCTECIWRNSSLHSGVAEAFLNFDVRNFDLS